MVAVIQIYFSVIFSQIVRRRLTWSSCVCTAIGATHATRVSIASACTENYRPNTAATQSHNAQLQPIHAIGSFRRALPSCTSGRPLPLCTSGRPPSRLKIVTCAVVARSVWIGWIRVRRCCKLLTPRCALRPWSRTDCFSRRSTITHPALTSSVVTCKCVCTHVSLMYKPAG